MEHHDASRDIERAKKVRRAATYLLDALGRYTGDVSIDDWLENAPPHAKLEVDVLAIEQMVILCRICTGQPTGEDDDPR